MKSDQCDARVREFISEVERACNAQGLPCGLRELLFCVRDIPYGRPTRPRDPLSVLTDWKGTCSGKHLLAALILSITARGARLYCHAYRLDDARDVLPRSVTQPYIGHGIWDVHNYLEIDAANVPLKIDVTWSRELAPMGFPTTLDWDGARDFFLAAPPGEAVQVESPDELNGVKDEMLSRLNAPLAQKLRERYIEDLAMFASRHCARPQREEGIKGTLAALRGQLAARDTHA